MRKSGVVCCANAKFRRILNVGLVRGVLARCSPRPYVIEQADWVSSGACALSVRVMSYGQRA